MIQPLVSKYTLKLSSKNVVVVKEMVANFIEDVWQIDQLKNYWESQFGIIIQIKWEPRKKLKEKNSNLVNKFSLLADWECILDKSDDFIQPFGLKDHNLFLFNKFLLTDGHNSGLLIVFFDVHF